LLLYTILLLKLLLHLVSVLNVLVFGLIFSAGYSVLCDCNLLPHLKIVTGQRFKLFLHATFVKLVIAECRNVISDNLLIE